MGNPARFLSGISTAAFGTVFGNLPLPDETDICVDFEDFNQYVAADWTVTNTTSHYTIGLVAASSTIPAGGVIGLVAGGSTANTDVAAIQSTPLNFYFTSGQQVWFAAHVRCANASNEAFMTGIGASAAALTPTDGIYFSKAAGAATVDFIVRASSTSTTASSVTTLAASTNTTLGFYYNGKDAVDVFVNGVKVYSQTTLTNMPYSTAMAEFLAIKASATAPTSAAYYSDYLFAAQERSF